VKVLFLHLYKYVQVASALHLIMIDWQVLSPPISIKKATSRCVNLLLTGWNLLLMKSHSSCLKKMYVELFINISNISTYLEAE